MAKLLKDRGDVSRRSGCHNRGGYTMLFRDGTISGVNLGAGVDRWMTDRVGMRFEFRDHIMMQEGASFHLWGPRISIVWR